MESATEDGSGGATQVLVAGRIVHYVPEDGRDHRAAMVCRVAPNDPDGAVDLQVFLAGPHDVGRRLAQDALGGLLLWRGTVRFDATGTVPGTWHWIEGSPGRIEQFAALDARLAKLETWIAAVRRELRPDRP